MGAISWVFAERAGFAAHGRYMLRFARDNRSLPALRGAKNRVSAEGLFTALAARAVVVEISHRDRV